MQAMIELHSSVKTVFKIKWLYFPITAIFFTSLYPSPSLSHTNGLALFTQQQAIRFKARWSDLGGMLCRIFHSMACVCETGRAGAYTIMLVCLCVT